MLSLKHIFKSSSYYVYCVEYTPEGPWLDNGSKKTFWFKLDNNELEELKIKQALSYDDGGSEEYKFTNGHSLFLPNHIVNPKYAASYWKVNKPIKYNDVELNVADVTEAAKNNVLKLTANYLN